jgi:hypothetical protein
MPGSILDTLEYRQLFRYAERDYEQLVELEREREEKEAEMASQ